MDPSLAENWTQLEACVAGQLRAWMGLMKCLSLQGQVLVLVLNQLLQSVL